MSKMDRCGGRKNARRRNARRIRKKKKHQQSSDTCFANYSCGEHIPKHRQRINDSETKFGTRAHARLNKNKLVARSQECEYAFAELIWTSAEDEKKSLMVAEAITAWSKQTNEKIPQPRRKLPGKTHKRNGGKETSYITHWSRHKWKKNRISHVKVK